MLKFSSNVDECKPLPVLDKPRVGGGRAHERERQDAATPDAAAAPGLADIARNVTGFHLTQEKRVGIQMRVKDVAGNICRVLPLPVPRM